MLCFVVICCFIRPSCHFKSISVIMRHVDSRDFSRAGHNFFSCHSDLSRVSWWSVSSLFVHVDEIKNQRRESPAFTFAGF